MYLISAIEVLELENGWKQETPLIFLTDYNLAVAIQQLATYQQYYRIKYQAIQYYQIRVTHINQTDGELPDAEAARHIGIRIIDEYFLDDVR